MTPIQTLESKINEANAAYRTGNAIITDVEYDQLIEDLTELDPSNLLLTKIGLEVIDEKRKVKLPIIMASVNKCKSLDEIKTWLRLKKIDSNIELIITPKFDGLSFCVNEETGQAYTRGDGVFGQRSDEHYKLIGNHLYPDDTPLIKYSYGEVMMNKKVFIDKYSSLYANPRNLIAGLINSKDIKDGLKDCLYIKYGTNDDVNFALKSEILEYLNKNQDIPVQFHLCTAENLNEEHLISLFKDWTKDFELDGLIIEINSLGLQYQLGRETSSNNPQYVRAFKHSAFDEGAETEVLDITWEISKQGLLKPVAKVRPVQVGGVTISNVTLNKAKFVRDNNIGQNSILKIIRSGGVIPKVLNVLKATGFQLPVIEGVEIGWNENGVELITLSETDNQRLKQIISFFEILEVDNVGEGVVKQLWSAGYRTVRDILNLTEDEFSTLEGFADRKASIVYNAIHSSLQSVELSKLKHASGCFVGLGSRKLVLLDHFNEKPTLDQLLLIEGFSDISANAYIAGYDVFYEFIDGLPLTIKQQETKSVVDGTLSGKVFVFSGFRDSAAEDRIIELGGKIGSGISKNVHYLVVKDLNSSSSKTIKAKELGIEILDGGTLQTLLN